MPKKKSKRPTTAKSAAAKKRYRRTDEELISDLKKKIKELRHRQDAKKLKESPAVKSTLSAIKWIDRALDAAADEGETLLRHALADARRPLEAHLSSEGVKLPKANLPRGRRPKGAAS